MEDAVIPITQSKKLGQRLLHFYYNWIIEEGRVRFLILLLCIVDFWWGFVLWFSPDIFKNSSSFTAIGDVASQPVTATMCLVFGVLIVISSIIRSVRALKALALMQTIFWLFTSYSIVFTNPLSTSTGVYFTISLISVVIFLRLGYGNQR